MVLALICFVLFSEAEKSILNMNISIVFCAYIFKKDPYLRNVYISPMRKICGWRWQTFGLSFRVEDADDRTRGDKSQHNGPRGNDVHVT